MGGFNWKRVIGVTVLVIGGVGILVGLEQLVTPRVRAPATSSPTTPPQESMEQSASHKLHLARYCESIKKPDKARVMYQQVIREFPGTPSSKMAVQELEKLK